MIQIDAPKYIQQKVLIYESKTNLIIKDISNIKDKMRSCTIIIDYMDLTSISINSITILLQLHPVIKKYILSIR